MFGTVIMDTYTKDEVQEIVDALDDLCSPNDMYGWSSAGIYCFWDYYAEEILYIGLASDLCIRFKQHNGLLPIDANCCKKSNIDHYFDNNDRLGYTIFVQSPLSQPTTFRNKHKYNKFAKQNDSSIFDSASKDGINDLKIIEGILIESYKKEYGHLPPWNSIGGSIQGQNHVMPNNINLVNSFCHPDWFDINPVISRSTLRELSVNPEYAAYEIFLHSVRVGMLRYSENYIDALKAAIAFDFYGYYNKIIQNKYLEKKLNL